MDEFSFTAERFFSDPEILIALSTKLVISLFAVASDTIKMKAINSLEMSLVVLQLQPRVNHLANLLLPYANTNEAYIALARLAQMPVRDKSLPLVSSLADPDIALSICRSTVFYRKFNVRQYAYFTGDAGISLGAATLVEEMLTGPQQSLSR